jgi:hypothetical protein
VVCHTFQQLQYKVCRNPESQLYTLDTSRENLRTSSACVHSKDTLRRPRLSVLLPVPLVACRNVVSPKVLEDAITFISVGLQVCRKRQPVYIGQAEARFA